TSPDEDCFDQVVSLLKDTSASTPIVFNCQGGISRTTTAMVMAALMKEFQLATELNCMKGIVPDDILEALKKKKLDSPGSTRMPPRKRTPSPWRYPDARIAKAQVDKLIDLAAPPPKGTGDKMTFDVASDDWQLFLKNKIMNNIQRYFYLIVFALYIREVGPQQYPITFKDWMAKHEDLSVMIAEGRGNLEWERKIPDENSLSSRISLPQQTSRRTWPRSSRGSTSWLGISFSDLPRGKHKNNSMHKLASKTMIEILPAISLPTWSQSAEISHPLRISMMSSDKSAGMTKARPNKPHFLLLSHQNTLRNEV
ncbi:Uncharacterized protein FKW44_024166, partial [Caligus rogercresseyi]